MNTVRIEQPATDTEIEFFLQETNSPYTQSCTAHIHTAIELLYIKEGSFFACLDGEEHRLFAGDLILFCSNAIHDVRTEGEGRNSYYVIKIPVTAFPDFSGGRLFRAYISRFAMNRGGEKTLWRREELVGHPLLPLLEGMVSEGSTHAPTAEISLKLKTLELLLAILREGEGDCGEWDDALTTLIYEAVLFVREHYAEDISERALATSLGVSYSYFSRSFKRVMRISFHAFLNRTRINRAEQLLARGGLSVTEVAAGCGYNTTSYFISVYRALTGRTPYAALHRPVIDSGAKVSYNKDNR